FKQEGRFKIVIHQDLMPFVSEISGKFTEYNLEHIAKFNSFHSIRIYEILSQYRNTKEKERTVLLADLKEWLQVSEKYDRWDNFKNRVLTPAIAEINEKSDLIVVVEQIKRGRSIVALKFTITQKSRSTRQIHGVFDEIKRPQVTKGSKAEGDWATENYNLAIKQLRDESILKTRFVEDSLKDLPSEWLKVLMKYTTIINHALTREIANELNKRG
ncbi:replication initiation protein, partial [Gallibacterium genomosp. 3]|uniref:replication initiation protein n=1 Tax=Gallibacterium genomosp. 3 TaxID=505345 RepID=UPI0009F3C58B